MFSIVDGDIKVEQGAPLKAKQRVVAAFTQSIQIKEQRAVASTVRKPQNEQNHTAFTDASYYNPEY